jgi:hypothetical protein
MKKVLLGLIFTTFMAANMSAQQVSINAGLAYSNAASIIDNSVGVMYGFVFSDNKVEISGDFNYFFDKAEDSQQYSPWALNLDVRYVTLDKGKYNLYPFVGVNMSQIYDLKSVGLNLGAGSRYAVNKRVAIFLDAKYSFGYMDGVYVALGMNLKP